MAERAEDIVQTEGVNRADINVALVIGLHVNSNARFNLVNRGVRVGDAGNTPRRIANLVNDTDDL